MFEEKRYGHEGAYQYSGAERDRWYTGKLGPDEDSKNLRFDFETTSPDDAGSFIKNVKLDLEDLIENGDTEDTQDALMKVWDGAKKRGKQAVDFKILAAYLDIEYKEKKQTTEYTLFLRPYVKWE